MDHRYERGDHNESDPSNSDITPVNKLSRNILCLLRSRELGNVKLGSEHLTNTRIFYNVITRWKSSKSYFGTPGFIRSFSPDGNYLISYSMNLKKVFIYEYTGVTSLMDCDNTEMIDKILHRHAQVDIGSATPYQIFLETTLFTSDSTHCIVFTNCAVADNVASMNDLYANNETPGTTNSPLEKYRIHAISLKDGVITGTISIDMDRIQSSPSVQGRLICLTSLHRQTIMIYSISKDTGELIHLKTIGQSMHPDDHIYLPNSIMNNKLAPFYSGLKQRIFTFLYKREKKRNNIKYFIDLQNKMRRYRICRVQILDTLYVLIRFQLEGEYGTSNFVLVLVHWEEGEVIDVWDKLDNRLLSAFEYSPWSFSQSNRSINRYPFSARTVPYHRHIYEAWDKAIEAGNTDNKSLDEYRRRILSFLPGTNTVYLNESPYIDPLTFRIDDTLALALTWGRIKMDNPHAQFKIECCSKGFSNDISLVVQCPPSRQLSILFHPIDPFIIFFDRYRTDHFVTIYAPNTRQSRI